MCIRYRQIARLLIMTLGLTLVQQSAFGSEVRRITVRSENYGYYYYRVDTDNRVRLIRQISRSACIQGRSWGYDHRGVWVDRGCEAEFEVGGGDDDKGMSGGKKAAIIGGVAGAGILTAILIAKSRDKDKNTEASRDGKATVPNWLVGTFRGKNPASGEEMQVTIYPEGKVAALYTGGTTRDVNDYGSYSNNRIQFGASLGWSVSRQGNGFRATADNGRSEYFRRLY